MATISLKISIDKNIESKWLFIDDETLLKYGFLNQNYLARVEL